MKIYTSIESFRKVENPVLTTGTFDGVHVGHQKIINQLNEIAGKVGGESVLLTFFPHPRMVLFPHDDSLKLLSTQEEKIYRLEKAGLQNLIVFPFTKEFSRFTYVEYVRDILVNKIGVKHLVIGYDHHFGRNREGSFDQLSELASVYDYKVEEIPALTVDDVKVSSTKIRKAIQEGEVDQAYDFLNYHYSLKGIVVEGNQIGRELGYPTANIQMVDRYKLVPGDGVYAVKVKLMNESFHGMMNIGYRPTVSGEQEHRIEVHILDFNQDIYGKIIEVEFINRIRNEMKFETRNQLMEQLKSDKQQALNILC